MIEPLTHFESKNNLDKIFYVDKYDELCQEHFKIKKIIPLRQPKWKLILDIILSITIIKFYLYGFFKIIAKFMKYTECNLEEAELLCIYCCDGKIYFEEIKKMTLPNVANSYIIISQSNYSRKSYLFTFKLFTYIYNPSTNAFNAIKYSIFCSKEQIFEQMSKGLTENEREYQKLIYGECDLNFKINSFFVELFNITCTFFFIFQVYSIILWVLSNYYAYSIAIAVMTIYNLLEETITTLSNLKNIRKISKYTIKVKIYLKTKSNDCNILEKDSLDLVPGDIFQVPDDGQSMPCDCILLSGSVIINEAMLTGESTPITKIHLPYNKHNFDEETDKKYFLFAGTKVIQKRKEKGGAVIALCYSTGFNSVKGNLIRSILYPVKVDSKFEKESVKFIFLMASLCVIGFLSVLPFKIKKARTKEDTNEEYKNIALEGLDLITTAVPPTLPCCLGIAIGIAQRRFIKKHIICINRNYITPAGKVTICVFDKTGTLTEDHLDIAGFKPVYAKSIKKDVEENFIKFSHNKYFFDKFYKSMTELSNDNYNYYKEKIHDPNKKTKKSELLQLFIECLACCQGITRVNGQLIGDPIDVQMFESTGWNLIEEPDDTNNYDPRITVFVRPSQEKSLTEKFNNNKNNNIEINSKKIKDEIKDHYEIGIIRRFNFSSKLQRMTIIAKNLIEENYLCFCKGSPEKIKELCMEKTLPEDFNKTLDKYTSKGYRVLGLACKSIKMTFSEALEVSRNFCEKDLIFLGLLIVENKLKQETKKTLKILREQANVGIKMATGDNILTAICVGRKSNLVDPNEIIYSCEIEKEESQNPNNEIINTINDINMRNSFNTNLYDNNLIKEKEKENIKRKLVWKTIEHFKEEEAEEKSINDEINIKNTINANLSVLLPQEIDENNKDEISVESLKQNQENLKKKEKKYRN